MHTATAPGIPGTCIEAGMRRENPRQLLPNDPTMMQTLSGFFVRANEPKPKRGGKRTGEREEEGNSQ